MGNRVVHSLYGNISGAAVGSDAADAGTGIDHTCVGIEFPLPA